MQNPWVLLVHSRKFWLTILDMVVSLITFFVGLFFAPAVLDKVLAFIAIIQPVVVYLINSIATEDVARMNAQGMVDAAKVTAAGTVSVAKVEENCK